MSKNKESIKLSKPLVFLICLISTFLSCFFIFLILYIVYQRTIFLTLYVTFMTLSYHFIMRCLVGETIDFLYKKREFHYSSFWYKEHKFEKKLYLFFHIHKLKAKAITARPETFDLKKNSLEDLIHTITQAEIVHEIIIILSFLPCILIIWYGVPLVFILTSIFGALCDLFFVMIQRYNRPRVIRLLKIMQKRNAISSK